MFKPRNKQYKQSERNTTANCCPDSKQNQFRVKMKKKTKKDHRKKPADHRAFAAICHPAQACGNSGEKPLLFLSKLPKRDITCRSSFTYLTHSCFSETFSKWSPCSSSDPRHQRICRMLEGQQRRRKKPRKDQKRWI